MAIKPVRLIQDILAEKVALRPDKVALICENQRLTYSQIDTLSNRFANVFIQHGVKDGERILFYMYNSAELVTGIFAALKANAIFSVVDYANTADTLRQICQDCQATLLVTHASQSEAAARLLAEVPSLRCAMLAGQGSPAPIANLLSLDALLESSPTNLPPQTRIDRDLAYLVYTSGSTGVAKGVMVTHRTCLFTINSGMEYLGLSEQDIHTSPLPLSFSPGINQLFQTFQFGGTLILERSFAFPAMILKRMAAEQATGFAGVPTVLELLIRMDLDRYDLSHLRYITSIGAALNQPLIQKTRQKFPRALFYSTYGMAEASYSLGLEPEQIDLRPTSVGKPFPGTQAWIMGEDGCRLGPEEAGELVVRGGHVRSGYWNAPDASARRFRPGPLPGELVCYTGDIFRTDKDGYFYFVARSDEVIKSGAKKVAPREIETALYALPGVLEAAAIGVPDPVLGQVIKAFVVLDEQHKDLLGVDAILKHCHKALEEFKVPRQVEIRASLPKTTSGKIKKTELT